MANIIINAEKEKAIYINGKHYYGIKITPQFIANYYKR